jgi:hypothetical protein
MGDAGELTLDRFAPRIGERFTLTAGEQITLPVTLSEAEALPESPFAPEREPFSLLLAGEPGDPILAQGTLRLEHPELGAYELFVVPLQPAGDSARYQIVFS